MAEGRSRDEWGRMASLLAMLANVHRDPKRTRPFKPEQFNPYLARRRRASPVSVDRLTEELVRVTKSRQGRR